MCVCLCSFRSSRADAHQAYLAQEALYRDGSHLYDQQQFLASPDYSQYPSTNAHGQPLAGTHYDSGSMHISSDAYITQQLARQHQASAYEDDFQEPVVERDFVGWHVPQLSEDPQFAYPSHRRYFNPDSFAMY